MKVIKPGRKDTPKEKVTCFTCEAKLEIEPSDLTTRPISSIFGSWVYNEHSIKCPECDSKIVIPTNSMSQRFFHAVKHSP